MKYLTEAWHLGQRARMKFISNGQLAWRRHFQACPHDELLKEVRKWQSAARTEAGYYAWSLELWKAVAKRATSPYLRTQAEQHLSRLRADLSASY